MNGVIYGKNYNASALTWEETFQPSGRWLLYLTTCIVQPHNVHSATSRRT